MKFKTYPSYKDSGIEWLGEVPEGWELKRIKYVGEAIIGLTYSPNDVDDNEGTIVLRSTNLKNDRIDLSNKVFVSSEIPKKLVLREGDILICSRNGSRKLIGKNALITENETGLTFGAFTTVLRSDFSQFLYFILNSSLFDYQAGMFLTTTINQLTTGTLNNFEIPFPSKEEQINIAHFLDNETRRIDELVEEKNHFIELLKEKRQALISHVVTKGLDPTVKMKDSGVEWLGEVPEHWVIKKIKYLFEIRKRIAGKEGYPVLSITQRGIKVKDTISGEGQLAMDYSKYQFVEIGDFAMNHMDLLTGYVDLSSFHGVTSPDYRVFTLTDTKSIDRYYLYLMQMGYKNKIFYSYGQGVANIGRWRFQTESFNDFCVPYPNKIVQQQIVNFLNKETTKIDALITETQNSIALLKEHRTALISAAVTGKIDVREVA